MTKADRMLAVNNATSPASRLSKYTIYTHNIGTAQTKPAHTYKQEAHTLARGCAPTFINLPRLPSVILRVALGEGLPLLRQVIEGEDRRDGADWDARAAI